MKEFNDFVIAFQKFRKSNKIPYGFNESLKYIWTIPESAAKYWRTDLDDSGYEEDIIKCYRDSFDPGNSLLGIHTNTQYSSNPSTCTLYELSETTHNFSLNNILYESEVQITNNSSTMIAVDGISLTLPFLVKPETFKFDDNRLYESSINGDKGLICSLYFIAGISDNNKLGSTSTFGTINYKNGKLSVNRINDSNEDRARQNYEVAKSWELNKENLSGKKPIEYIRSSLSGSFIEFTTPITPIYAFNIN